MRDKHKFKLKKLEQISDDVFSVSIDNEHEDLIVSLSGLKTARPKKPRLQQMYKFLIDCIEEYLTGKEKPEKEESHESKTDFRERASKDQN